MKKKDKKVEVNGYIRPSWDEYFFDIMKMVGTRSTCDRGRAGAVIVRDRRILSTGYAGSPIGVKHCDDVGHEMHTVIHDDGQESEHCIRTTHAEQNAIAQAARSGIALEGSTIYIRMTPCYTCAKIIINSGIVRVVCLNDYHAGKRSKEVLKESGVLFELVDKICVSYD